MYDPLDRRIQTLVDADGTSPNAAVQKRFVYDGDEIYLQFDNGSTSPSHRYLHGPGVDEVLADQDFTGGTPVWKWIAGDHQNSVRDIVDGTWNYVLNRKEYDSFGNIKSELNTSAAADVIFGYTGREFDEATGLQYNRARYYDPELGRFISSDPSGFAGGDSNLYRYAANNPMNATDPSGLGTIFMKGNSNGGISASRGFGFGGSAYDLINCVCSAERRGSQL